MNFWLCSFLEKEKGVVFIRVEQPNVPTINTALGVHKQYLTLNEKPDLNTLI